MLFWHGDGFACPWVAPGAGLTVSHRECAKPAQFDPRTSFKRLRDRFQKDSNHPFHIPTGQVRIFLMELIDELGT